MMWDGRDTTHRAVVSALTTAPVFHVHAGNTRVTVLTGITPASFLTVMRKRTRRPVVRHTFAAREHFHAVHAKIVRVCDFILKCRGAIAVSGEHGGARTERGGYGNAPALIPGGKVGTFSTETGHHLNCPNGAVAAAAACVSPCCIFRCSLYVVSKRWFQYRGGVGSFRINGR